MHCASLGEFEQGRPLLESIKKGHPSAILYLSFFSASGFEVMKNYPVANHIFYLPIDRPAHARRLLAALKPSLVIWVKYEFWYYYLREMRNKDIPLLLVSGNFRPGQPFFQWYGGIWRAMLSCFSYIFVQNEASRQLLSKIGITRNLSVAGDTRFDRVIEIAEKFQAIPPIAAFCEGAKVIVAGSTWEEDEAELIHYVRANPQVKFLLAPHEVSKENLADVKKEFAGSVFYSEWLKQREEAVYPGPSAPHVLIIDNVGMLSRLYYYADITYVGGGFGAEGVHNVLEPAVYGKPVLFGPEYEKFPEAAGLVDCGGGISIENALELEKTFNEFWQNESLLKQSGASARQFVYSNAGATNKIMQYIQENRLLTN